MKEPMNPRYLIFRHLKIVMEMCFMQALSCRCMEYGVCEAESPPLAARVPVRARRARARSSHKLRHPGRDTHDFFSTVSRACSRERPLYN